MIFYYTIIIFLLFWCWSSPTYLCKCFYWQ